MNPLPVLISPVRQEVWGLSAVINFCAGGAGSILYGLSFLLPPCGAAALGLSQVHFLRLCCVLLVALGFAAVGIESRKPMNARFLFDNLRRSWMSIEVLAGLLFVILAVMGIVLPYEMLELGAVVLGVLLFVCQVMIIHDARGVMAWNTRLVAAHALSSNLFLACGMGLIFCSFGGNYKVGVIMMVALASLGLNHIAWRKLLGSPKSLELGVALEPLRTPMNLAISVWVGHIFPALVLAFGVGIELLLGINFLIEELLALSGAMIVIGGTAQKTAIILGANSLKAIKPGQVKSGQFIHVR